MKAVSPSSDGRACGGAAGPRGTRSWAVDSLSSSPGLVLQSVCLRFFFLLQMGALQSCEQAPGGPRLTQSVCCLPAVASGEPGAQSGEVMTDDPCPKGVPFSEERRYALG